MEQITLGNVSIARVREYHGSADMEPRAFFPETSQEVRKDGVHRPAPHFLDSETRFVNSAIQTRLLRSGGKTETRGKASL
jgi:hypothetical protein